MSLVDFLLWQVFEFRLFGIYLISFKMVTLLTAVTLCVFSSVLAWLHQRIRISALQRTGLELILLVGILFQGFELAWHLLAWFTLIESGGFKNVDFLARFPGEVPESIYAKLSFLWFSLLVVSFRFVSRLKPA